MKKHFCNFLVLLILALGTGCGDKAVLKNKELIFQRVIDQVQSGELNETTNNSIQLPSNLKAASLDGEVLISRPSATQLILVFKTWQGKGNNMEGILFAAKPFANGDIRKDSYGQEVVPIGPIDLTLEKEIKPNWYRVSFRLD